RDAREGRRTRRGPYLDVIPHSAELVALRIEALGVVQAEPGADVTHLRPVRRWNHGGARPLEYLPLHVGPRVECVGARSAGRVAASGLRVTGGGERERGDHREHHRCDEGPSHPTSLRSGPRGKGTGGSWEPRSSITPHPSSRFG